MVLPGRWPSSGGILRDHPPPPWPHWEVPRLGHPGRKYDGDQGPPLATHSPQIPAGHQAPRSPVTGDNSRPVSTHCKCLSSPSGAPLRRSCSRKGRALSTEQETSSGWCR